MNIRHTAAIFITFVFITIIHAQNITTNLTTDPQKAPFVIDDIHTFNTAFKLLANESDTARILQSHYLDKGTPGLKIFIEKYDLTSERLTRAIHKHPEKYASLSEISDFLREKIKIYRRAYAQLKNYIPDIDYPPTYFLVAGYWGIGCGLNPLILKNPVI